MMATHLMMTITGIPIPTGLGTSTTTVCYLDTSSILPVLPFHGVLRSKPSIALSSTEGEYMALTHAVKEAMWIRRFLSDILLADSLPTTILGDNQGALALSVNPTYHAHTKHIQVWHHFIRECIESGNINLKYIPMADQVADTGCW